MRGYREKEVKWVMGWLENKKENKKENEKEDKKEEIIHVKLFK